MFWYRLVGFNVFSYCNMFCYVLTCFIFNINLLYIYILLIYNTFEYVFNSIWEIVRRRFVICPMFTLYHHPFVWAFLKVGRCWQRRGISYSFDCIDKLMRACIYIYLLYIHSIYIYCIYIYMLMYIYIC
jgi:hypothetical protein